jgi:hypothetical protein
VDSFFWGSNSVLCQQVGSQSSVVHKVALTVIHWAM